jgi:hypothetical protein
MRSELPMITYIYSNPLAGFWNKLGARVAAMFFAVMRFAVNGRRGAVPVAVVKVRRDESAQTDALIDALLAFAQARGLGIEHNLVKDRLVFYRGATPQAPQQAPEPEHPNLVAFPMKKAMGSSRAVRARLR